MKIIDSLRNYVIDERFEFKFINGKLNVINYDLIKHFDSNKIVVNYKDGSIIIYGKNLTLSRLLNNEILISGVITNIEMGN